MNDNNKTKNDSWLAKIIADIHLPTPAANIIFFTIVIAGFALDLWTKHAIFQWLGGDPWKGDPNVIYPVIDGFFNLVTRLNPGAAFSIASGQRVILLSVSIVALVVILGVFLFGHLRSKTLIVAFALFTAGIMGNLFDRAFNDGLVRDFLDFYVGDYHWPAFNVADSMLCIAVGLLIICNIMTEVSQRRDHSQKTEP
ncbi:MAG: signal peptidase II [Planctomycetes bacterium]|nr:signal peptidase II [Planctomycetota bacterium]